MSRAEKAAAQRERVLELRREGLSYAAIGKQLGLTMQRAWQIGTGYVKPRETKAETLRSYLAKRKREHDEHARVINAMLAAGLCE